MSDHLPECPIQKHLDSNWDCPTYCDGGCQSADCFCDRLRACEHRVRLHAALSWEQGFEEGRTAGLDAAREAVARLQHKPGASIANAVSAIDALSENPDDQPVLENPNDAR